VSRAPLNHKFVLLAPTLIGLDLMSAESVQWVTSAKKAPLCLKLVPTELTMRILDQQVWKTALFVLLVTTAIEVQIPLCPAPRAFTKNLQGNPPALNVPLVRCALRDALCLRSALRVLSNKTIPV
jgi:hypothetical protein